jgi:3-phenylpropionate/cinnamic acid dioxygenase small subunit
MAALDERAMSTPTSLTVSDQSLARFYYLEAAMLDDRRWDDWLALWADDATYAMPVRSETLADDAWGRSLADSYSNPGELQYFDEPAFLLGVRVQKLKSGKAWAEQPPSHTTRLITNVHALAESDDGVTVHSNFLIHRTRVESRVEQFVGTRRDLLRADQDSWRIAGRRVYLNANVLDASNLQLFF